MEAILRRQLKDWRRAFRKEHDREPTKSDMQRDPDMASTYDTWRALTRSGSSRSHTSRREAAGPPRSDTPATPKKTKAAPMPAPSPGNPFRSPQKPTKHYAQMPQFPLASHEVPAAEPESESDVSDMDVEPAAAQTTPVQRTPKSLPTQLPLYTPRTKARKRLRGEDVTTPPHERLKRTASQTEHARLLAQSPHTSSRRSMSRIFSGPSHDLDTPAGESYGPSPRKSQVPGGFLPLFHSDSSTIPGAARAPLPEASEPPAVELVPATQTSAPERDADQGAAASGPPSRATPSASAHQPAPMVVDVDGDAKIHVVPYRRYDSFPLADQIDFDDNVLALPHTELDHVEAPTEHVVGADRLSHVESRTLSSPQKHAQRALHERRARNDEMVLGLVGHAEPPAAPGIPRTGRSGLDVDEDVLSHPAEDDDDDWASEASSADYGLGDGGMDVTDVV
ncbi:hypothetical protein MCAP1_002301 [Malassezia caprae]|uniref:DNA replication regulator SLD2 n=1 Tax=Malassezia caprae TaxID=1381934 RepID=A0AAF0ECJ3_9BASI|nr:hypothetical protein MCAP1_002301 [Malassezia caprae]